MNDLFNFVEPQQFVPTVQKLIAGVDEVGRGPLVGDVVAAAVILEQDHGIVGLRDSKKLTAKKREQLFVEIKNKALAVCIARATPQEIDSINILQASLLAMKRAVQGLHVQPQHVLVDGNKLPQWTYSSEAIVGGDDLEDSIAAASIVAKVTRDKEMYDLDKVYPQYGFAQHKGYPTQAHIQALAEFGPCELHRKSFKPVQKVLLAQEQ